MRGIWVITFVAGVGLVGACGWCFTAAAENSEGDGAESLPPAPPFSGAAVSEGVVVRQGEKAVEVLINGELFTRCVFSGARKPYCWPIIGPTGKAVTRAFPMQQVAEEATDHPHQKSMWFTHGDVNGVDFWGEGEESGTQVHRGFEILEGGRCWGPSARARTGSLRTAPKSARTCGNCACTTCPASGSSTSR